MVHLLFSLLLAPASHAHPPPQVIQLVQGALVPGITFTASDPDKSQGDCSQQTVTVTGADPITKQPRKVTLNVYTPVDPPSPLKAMLLFPPTGGESFMDRDYASMLCSAKIEVAILDGWDNSGYQELDLGVYDRAALRTLAAAEHAIEYLKPSGQIGVLGTSLGALGAAFTLGYDARIKTGLLIVGGDNMPDIIAHSDQADLAAWRQKQMDANHLGSVADFENELKQNIQLNPSTFADYSGAKTLMLYMATEDTTVPSADQLLLRQAYGNPPAVTFEGTHMQTILHVYLNESQDVVGFFQKNL